MKFLIVGLGNPGVEYENTRHNIGFKVLDEVAAISQNNFEEGKYGKFCTFKFKSRTITLLKPTTFMNLSGKAVRYWLQHLKLDVAKLLIVTDDISLPPGVLRMRGSGSDGGHNGLKNINLLLNTNNYSRLRFGIGSNFSRGEQSTYVLKTWDESENIIFIESIKKSVEMVHSFCISGIDQTMNQYNNKTD